MVKTPSLRWSGLLFMVAGGLFGTFMFFHPANNPQGALEPIWVPVHVLWFISYLLIACSLVPLYVLISSQDRLTIISYWLSFIGTILSLPIAVWDSFVVPYLAKHAPDFIIQIEELSVEPSVFVFRVIVFLTIFLFCLGFILFGIASIRLQLLPKVAGGCVAAGAPLFWIGALFISKTAMGNLITEIGALLFGIGLVMLGKTLFANFSAIYTYQD